MSQSKELGTQPIGKLLVKMAVPASIGILVMSIYFIVDTIFVGRFVGALGIAAITVVMPITFLISSIGMAIGVGGASIISRALGGDRYDKACRTFGNMIGMTVTLAILLVLAGASLEVPVLRLFGANGDILTPSQSYFRIILIGVPALAWAMMSNNVMRAEGEPRMAMLSMMIPAVANIILDPIFIIYLDMGLEGAGWATTISYYLSAAFALWFFLAGRSELRIDTRSLLPSLPIVKEIGAIGSVTLARQGTISLLTIVLNHSLFQYGSEMAVAVFGLINRIMMFANFPVLGLTQGFLPIAGYNYGARQWKRVRETLRTSIRTGTLIAVLLLGGITFFAESIVGLFTTDPELLRRTPRALIMVFILLPLIPLQLIGSAYFQAIGKALPALLLTISKQGFFLIPLVLTLPLAFDLDGIWYAFPLSDLLAGVLIYFYLQREIRKDLAVKITEEATRPKTEALVGSESADGMLN